MEVSAISVLNSRRFTLQCQTWTRSGFFLDAQLSVEHWSFRKSFKYPEYFLIDLHRLKTFCTISRIGNKRIYEAMPSEEEDGGWMEPPKRHSKIPHPSIASNSSFFYSNCSFSQTSLNLYFYLNLQTQLTCHHLLWYHICSAQIQVQ